MDIRTALQQGSRLLEEAGISEPRLTAEVLLSHALKRERTWLFAHPEEDLDGIAGTRYNRSLLDRLHGKPCQYIIGRQEFYGRDFLLTQNVFIPRPETEYVVEQALKLSPRPAAILDVGCGSGNIAVTLSLEAGATARVFATDISAAALAVARTNAKRLGARVAFLACDLASAIADRSLDLLVSNPPYIPTTEEPGLPREVREFEPRIALFAGPEGLDVYRKLVAEAPRVLRPGGWIVFELGYRQVDAVCAMLDGRWKDMLVVSDLAGLPRVFVARLSA
ncbi:MAG: peptide chain release factor N(5)-glutamine methyltransferase [Bryobacteraceae bacterium]|jgi:release factor glutamine methyltransferase